VFPRSGVSWLRAARVSRTVRLLEQHLMKRHKVSTISSIEELLAAVRTDYGTWKTETYPWFRGELARTDKPLLPKLFRSRHSENKLLQQFRMKAPALGLGHAPPRDHTDQWLFLAQHVGVPTRLLDWTEGLLVALFFALHRHDGQPRDTNEGAAVWMLDPVGLNQLSSDATIGANEFPLSWFSPETRPTRRGEVAKWFTLSVAGRQESRVRAFAAIRAQMGSNIGNVNIRRAWGERNQGTDLPVAIHPTSIHPRVTAQKSCFTIHGKKELPLSTLVGERVLRSYVVDPKSVGRMRADLRMSGMSYSTIFPDLDGLAVDLGSWF
jgi:hypothetical protein